jgi:fatty acid desaturase
MAVPCVTSSDDELPKSEEITIRMLREAIGADAFVKSEIHFLFHLLCILSLFCMETYLACVYIPLITNLFHQSMIIYYVLWITHFLISGTIGTGLWVLGHECGHGSFSKKEWKNDFLGYILHTFWLVPYFSWARSHEIHHSKNNDLYLGETHIPVTNDTFYARFQNMIVSIIGEDAFVIIRIFVYLTIGWLSYLFIGSTGGKSRGITNHFIPGNKLFPEPAMFRKVWISTIGCCGMLSLLYLFYLNYDMEKLICIYLGPYFVVNMWLVTYTWLQHTRKDIIYYDTSSWSQMKGALQTIDRYYPWIIDQLHFHIGTTHVVHHIFSYLPHYNAPKATKIIKCILEPKGLYKYDNSNLFKAIWDSAHCIFLKRDVKNEGQWIF